MNKKGFEMSFAWIFAIIVGAFILFLAVLMITKVSDNQNYSNDLKGAKEITVLADNFELGYETSSISTIKMPTNSRLYLNCDANNLFGKQELILRSELYDQWSETGKGIKSENKYFFLEEPLESRGLIVFSRVFEFPFKVATLSYFLPVDEEYCFIDPPSDVERELEKNNITNFKMEACSSKSTKICFNPLGGEDCDTIVIFNSNEGTVQKNLEEVDSKKVYYEGFSLMFAAILSDSEIYECQLQRLMLRTNYLIELYLGKATYDQGNDCSTNQRNPLEQLNQELSFFEDSSDLPNLASTVEILESNSRGGGCQLW